MYPHSLPTVLKEISASNLRCDFSGTSSTIPVTFKGRLPFNTRVLPRAFSFPKYFFASDVEMTREFDSDKQVWRLPERRGYEKRSKNVLSTISILPSLKVLLSPFPSWYVNVEALVKSEIFTTRTKLSTSGKSFFIAGPTAG